MTPLGFKVKPILPKFVGCLLLSGEYSLWTVWVATERCGRLG